MPTKPIILVGVDAKYLAGAMYHLALCDALAKMPSGTVMVMELKTTRVPEVPLKAFAEVKQEQRKDWYNQFDKHKARRFR